MQLDSFQKNVMWRPISPLLYEVDNGDAVKRLEMLRDSCYGKSPAEIYMQFNPATIGDTAERQFARLARIVEGIRNALVFAPLMIMLISLGIAAQAYSLTPHSPGTAFFNDWIRGFPTVSSVTTIFGIRISLIDQKHQHWFTFSSVLITDFAVLFLVVVLTLIAQWMEGGALRKARRLTVWLDEEFSQLCNASFVKSIGVGPGSEQPEWAVHVHEAIYKLHQVLQGVEGAMDISQKKFSDTIERFVDVYDKQNTSVDKLLQGTKEVGRTVDNLGGIYLKLYEASEKVADALPDVARHLSEMVDYQQQMTSQLKRLTDDIHQLAQPFRAVGLAEMARQVEKQQKENLNLLNKIEKRLTQAQAVPKGWFRRLFSR